MGKSFLFILMLAASGNLLAGEIGHGTDGEIGHGIDSDTGSSESESNWWEELLDEEETEG